MRILYIDIDTLRPDHLGCYGYHRETSPNIDAIANEGVRFENCYVSDAPCMPSRTALWSGRFGYQTGVVDHGGIAAQPFVEGPTRGFWDTFDRTSWMSALRKAGYKTVTVSSFAERHSAWHWYAEYSEIYNPGKRGMDIADDVTPIALDWIERNADEDQWFLHVNYWDPHIPFRTPMEFGNPFSQAPIPSWIDEETLRRGWDSYGPGSPQDLHLWHGAMGKMCQAGEYPRVPIQIDSMEALRMLFDGYDTGIRYVDKHVGILVTALEQVGVLDDTAIILSADHGESLGELNIFGDHQTADNTSSRVPLIIRWPGITDQPRVDQALHYHFDWAATAIELVGGKVPLNWNGRSFADAIVSGREDGRDFLVLSQAAWSCQRSIRFNYDGHPYLCMRTFHDGYKDLDQIMLFDLENDFYERRNLRDLKPELIDHAMGKLLDWHQDMMLQSKSGVDPMMTVMKQGGPFHVRGKLAEYQKILRDSGRQNHAETLSAKHPMEI